jgi:hypothetical protein
VKGPRAILSQTDLAELYSQFNHDPLSVDEACLAFAIEQSRLDPRLAEIVCEFIREYWWKVDAAFFNKKLRKTAWPGAVLPMLEEIRQRCRGSGEERKEFFQWQKKVGDGIQNRSSQMYFIQPWLPESRRLEKNIEENQPWFQKFNFISNGTFFNKDRPKSLSMGKLRLSEKEKLKIEVACFLRQQLKKIDVDVVRAAEILGTDKTTVSQINRLMVKKLSLDFLFDVKERFHNFTKNES